MRTIWKYKIPVLLNASHMVNMPVDALVTDVKMQGDIPVIWAEVEDSHPLEARVFRWVGTGHELLNQGWAYVKTVQIPPYVWHLYETD